MKLSNVKEIFKDWVKGGFRFGKTFSNFVAEKLEMHSEGARKGTGVFDTLAGGALTYLGVTSAIGTVAGALLAVSAITAAPFTALFAVVLAPIWLAFSTVMTGIGLGLLDSAREKFGLSRDIAGIPSAAKKISADTTSGLRSLISRGKKASGDFKTTAKAKKDAVKAAAKKPATNKTIDL